MRGVISHESYEVEYFTNGNGKKILFAFHGFNNHAEDFRSFADVAAEYTVVSINIFFHGQSRADNELVKRGFSIDDIRQLFCELSKAFPVEKYTWMGYSLGGRLVMKFFELFPERTEKVILIAPDGLYISPMYAFVTRTSAGRGLLKRVTGNPSGFFHLANALRKTGLVTEKKYQFAMGNFDSEEKRNKVYRVWLILRKIHTAKSDLHNIIKKYKIPVMLFFGKHDRIIPPSYGANFQKGMEAFISLNILDAGHMLLKESTLKQIAEIARK